MPNPKQVGGADKRSKYAGAKARTGIPALRLGQIGGEALSVCIDAVVGAGDAILFGRTSDGGAISLRVLSDGVTECWYPTDVSELLEVLEAITAIAAT